MLLNLIDNKHKIISLVGMAKNCGKTTTLNQLVMEATDANLQLGITSIGRDGEKQDIVTYTEKPLIHVKKGTLVATAEETFKLSEAKMEILEVTDMRTSLGKVILGRVIQDGYIQVAGPVINKEIRLVSDRMLNLGADLVAVDGSIDRLSAASPAITEGTILATGAVLSRDMNKVIAETAYKVNLFKINEIEDEDLRLIAKDTIDNTGITIVDGNYSVKNLNLKTSLNSGSKIADNIDQNSKYIIIGGSLVSKTIKDLVNHTILYKNVTLVVEDSTKIFINQRDWHYFQRIGVEVRVFNSINILAITLNPYSPRGYYFDPNDFLKNMRKIIHEIPVVDVMISG